MPDGLQEEAPGPGITSSIQSNCATLTVISQSGMNTMLWSTVGLGWWVQGSGQNESQLLCLSDRFGGWGGWAYPRKCVIHITAVFACISDMLFDNGAGLQMSVSDIISSDVCKIKVMQSANRFRCIDCSRALHISFFGRYLIELNIQFYHT